jgi:hypothetical protein
LKKRRRTRRAGKNTPSTWKPKKASSRKNLLFVNKKKQKNFIHWQPALSPTGSHMKKIFASFFSKKEDSSCPPLA